LTDEGAVLRVRVPRCTAVTAALVHHPVTVFAQVSMMPLGDPLTVSSYRNADLSATSEFGNGASGSSLFADVHQLAGRFAFWTRN